MMDAGSWQGRLQLLLRGYAAFERDYAAFANWRRQPSTVVGFSLLGGTFAALANNQITWPQAIGPLVTGVIAMAIPDNANRKVSAVPAAVADASPAVK